MIIIYDRKLEPVGALTEGNYFEDLLTEKLENSYFTFEFKVPLQVPQHELIEEEGFVMVSDLDGRKQLFTVVRTFADHQTKTVEAEHISVNDLNDALVAPATLPSQLLKPLLTYILEPLSAEYEVGEVAEDVLTVDVEFDGYMTVREALNMVSELFDVEVFFETDLRSNRVGKTKVHAVKQRGTRTNLTLDYGTDVEGIEREVVSTELYTSVIPVGKNGLTMLNYTGALEDGFTHTDRAVNNVAAFEQYARRGRHKQTYLETEDTDKGALYKSAVSFLKAHSKPQYLYSVSAVRLEQLTGYEHKKVRLGDTIIIRDFLTDKDNPLILQARVVELVSSKTNQEGNQVVLGEYVRLAFKRSDDITTIQRKIKNNEEVWNSSGEVITKSPTEPPAPYLDQLWLDTSTEPYVMYMWNGYAWVEAGSTDLTDIEDKLAELEENTTPLNIVQTVVQSADVQTMLNQKADVEDLSDLATGEQLTAVQDAAKAYTDERVDYTNEQVNILSSAIEKTAQDIRMEFTSAGGINLVRNSLGYGNILQPIDYWETTGSIDIYKTADLEALGYISGWGGQGTAVQNIILAPNKPYSLSLLVNKMVDASTNARIVVEVNETVAGVKRNLITAGSLSGDGTTNGFEVAVGEFTPTQNTIEVKIIIEDNAYGIITALMINEGTQAFAWNHHPEETYGNNILFNQNGMRVQQVDSQGNSGLNYTQITTTEFAGYGREDQSVEYKKIFALNGETTLVQKIAVEEEFLMGPLKMRKMTTDTSTKNGWAILIND